MAGIGWNILKIIDGMTIAGAVSAPVFFFLQNGGASWGRVCYQQGLPRLVLGYSDFPQSHIQN